MQQNMSNCLKDDEILIVDGKVEAVDGQEITLILEEAKKIADAVSQKAQNVSIILPGKNVDEKYLEDIFTILSRDRGNCQVFLKFTVGGECVFSKFIRSRCGFKAQAVLRMI